MSNRFTDVIDFIVEDLKRFSLWVALVGGVVYIVSLLFLLSLRGS